jgi:hypothetical protein
MSLFDAFRAAPAAPATSANANPTVPSAATAPVPVAQPGAAPATPAEPASPLAKYTDLWKTDPNAKPDAPFSFNSDPAKLLDTAKTVDFTKVISPELQARITAGGADAQTAMMEAMNGVAQMSFAQSAHASAKIVESALQAQEDRFKEMLPQLIKQHSVADSFRNDNPLLTDPALAPMVGALQVQFTKQYPQATAAEIKSHVNDFLNGAADKIHSSRPQPKAAVVKKTEDWERFFTQAQSN